MEAAEGTVRGRVQGAEAEPAPPTAVLRFRHSPGGSGVSRTGHLRPGGRLVVEYDPARLPPSADAPGTSSDIICYVWFHPGGQRYSGSVLDRREGLAQAAPPRHIPFEVRIPTDATQVELWFESRGPAGTSGWDSRYGRNYSFVVIGEGLPVPEPSVVPRADTIEDPAKIWVLEDAAAKEETRMGTAGRRLRSTLGIHALVAEPTGLADAWADVHVFDAAGELIHAGSVALQQRESTADGTLFVWEDDVYQGSGGGSGIGAWSRPDAHTIQYRLYCQPHQPGVETPRQVFTDGVLHEFELPADEEVGGPR